MSDNNKKTQISKNITFEKFSCNEFTLAINGVTLTNLGLLHISTIIQLYFNKLLYKTLESQIAYRLYRKIRYNNVVTTTIISNSELKDLDNNKLVKILKDVAEKIEVEIASDVERSNKINGFNNRIDRVLEAKGLSNSVKLENFSIDKYACTKKYKTKDELQDLYKGFVKTLTGKQLEFRRSSYSKSVKDTNNLVVMSKKSKWLDFLSVFYAIENMDNVVESFIDEYMFMQIISTSNYILHLMGCKLGLLNTSKNLLSMYYNMTQKDKLQLIRIELALGLI